MSSALAPVVSSFALDPTDRVCIISEDIGQSPQGLYVYTGRQWMYAMSMPNVSAAIIRGDTISVYLNSTDDTVAPAGSTVFKNGIEQSTLNITHGPSLWTVRTPPAGGGSGGGDVTSVNGQTGVVLINAANLPGLSTVGMTGSYNDLTDTPTPYVLAISTPTTLGGVIVPASSFLSIDVDGNIDVKASLLGTINSKLSSVVSNGTGISLVRGTTAGAVTMKDIVAGTNVTVLDDGAGSLTISSDGLVLPIATASVLGGVKIGSGIAVTADGTISVTAAYTLPAATSVVLGGVKQGSGVAIAVDGTLSVTPYTLPVATVAVLGGVKQGTGVTIDGDGTINVSSSYVLPAATDTILGGVKEGAGVAIAADGTISVADTPIATTTTVGTVKAGSGLNVAGDGTLSTVTTIASAGALGSVRVGTGLSIDGAGILSLSAAAGVASINAKTGAVVIAAGTGITVDNSGANVVVNLALTSPLVTAALGFTPYNATNPDGYISANQAITYTGDATGTGTTAVTLTLANSGVAAGTFKSVTVDAKGRVTSGTNPTTLTGFGITDALNSVSGGSVAGTITLTGGAKVTGLPTPTIGGDATNKTYVDNAIASVANGTSWRLNAQAATTANIVLTGEQTIDGYAAVTGDRVLVKDQTDQTENGVYIVDAAAWTRATDTDTGPEILGMAILVLNGTANPLSQWVNTNTSAITIGTTNITFTKLQGNGVVYNAGTGLTLTGNTFSITNTGVTAGTYTKVTINAQGQVTTGANLASSDVTTALGFTPYNSTNPSNYISANQTITVSGDATGTGTTTLALVLANSGVTAGTYKSVTVDAKGRVTAGTNPTTLAGYGITNALANTGGSMGGTITFTTGTVTGLPTPTVGGDAVNKTYADAAQTATANAVTWKTRVAAATTANITLSGTQTIDGYAAVAGDRILVKNQTAAADNGIYVVAAGAWTRATDAATGATISALVAIVLNGTVNALTQWVNTNTGAITLGTTSISFSATAAASSTPYTAGTGLTLTGQQFSITNTGVTAGTFTKVTVNAQGQVTTGANLASGDVTTALGYTPLQNNQTITLSGDVTGSGATGITTTLANSGVTAGTYTKVTVDAKGRVTLGANLTNAEIVAAVGYTPVNRAGDTMTGTFNQAPTVNVSAAATSNVGSALGNDINILGAATINGFNDAPVGSVRTLKFFAACTLVHNAASFVLLANGGNITTANGDSAQFTSIGTNQWRMDYYARANGSTTVPDTAKLALAGGTMTGALNYATPVTLASAATVNIGAAAANDISVTGTVTITAFDSIPAGAIRKLTFAGALTLTHNATSLILPTGANITTAAGDIAQFTSLGGGNWRCDYYTKVGGVFITTTSTDTLTNKTLSNAVIAGFVEAGATATGASFSPDFTTGTDFEYTTSANTTITLPAAAAGRSYTITVKYGGVHTIAFAGGTLIKYQNGTVPTATSVSGKWDIYVFKCDRAGTATMVSDGGRNF